MGEPPSDTSPRMPQLPFYRNANGVVNHNPATLAFNKNAYESVLPASHSLGSVSASDRAASFAMGPRHQPLTAEQLAFESYRAAPAVVIRKLAPSIGDEALGSMLIFAGDLLDTEFIRSPYPDDRGYATAIARFRSQAGALEAQQKLNGKPNTTKEATMIVELHLGSTGHAFGERRNTIDGPRSQTSSASSAGSVSGGGRSRFNSTFQSTERPSPPSTAPSSSELPVPETSPRFQHIFSAQSPHTVSNGFDYRASGKSTINDETADLETGKLLQDPVAYARSNPQPHVRRTTNPQIPMARFGSLSLNTSGGHENGISNGTSNGMGSPLANGHPQRPVFGSMSAISPTQTTQNGGFNGQYTCSQFPPINPADQNPPCNTLYVGNLPIDTSEDELKSIFSKQRGYKRLCFRTKTNGPMCFVEFEDISFATKALSDLYGHVLHNSTKGGIRLSFSKNPLGVRSDRLPNGIGGSHTPVYAMSMASSGYGGMASNGFSAVSGPPPGLSNTSSGSTVGRAQRPPPGIASNSYSSNSYSSNGYSSNGYSNNGYSVYHHFGNSNGNAMATGQESAAVQQVSPRTVALPINNAANGTKGANGTNGANGANGANGVNGANRANGANGANGTNGRGFSDYMFGR